MAKNKSTDRERQTMRKLEFILAGRERQGFVTACILLALAFLGGCAAPSKTFVDSKGKQQTCASAGFGWLGAPLAVAMYADCVNRMENAGLKAIDDSSETKFDPVAPQSAEFSVAMRPVYEVGDFWRYKMTGAVTGDFTQAVEDITIRNGDRSYVMRLSDGTEQTVDNNLNIIELSKDGVVTEANQPPIKMLSWPFRVGDTWDTDGTRIQSDGTKFNYDMNVKVVGYGKVKVPAGDFEAFYIKATAAGSDVLAQEIWYSPKSRSIVKRVDYFSEGKVEKVLLTSGSEAVGPVETIFQSSPSLVQEVHNNVSSAPTNPIPEEDGLSDERKKALVLCAELGFEIGSSKYRSCVDKASQ